MKIATWNVNGIRKRMSEVLAWIDREEPDVICLQETKAAAEQIPAPLATVAGYHARWHGARGGYSGVALLLHHRRFAEAPRFTHPPFDLESRIVVAEAGALVLASTYVPNGGKDLAAKMQFLEELAAWAGGLAQAGRHLILCGDFNVTRAPADVHPSLRRDMIGQSAPERALLERLLAADLVDVGRHCDPDNDRLFTWWAPWRNMRQRNIGWRLDYVAAHRALVDEAAHCAVHRDVGTSDHAPVIAHLRDAPR